MINTKNQNINLITKLELIGSNAERDYFIENLSLLLRSGLNLSSALSSIRTGIKNRGLLKIIDQVKNQIDEGVSLNIALNGSGLLPSFALSLIKIGEESGRLTENLKIVASQLRKDQLIRSRLRSAMIYPVLVLGVTASVGLSVAWFILPRLSQVFLGLKLKLPPLTKALIFTAKILTLHGYWLVPSALLIIVFGVYFLLYNRRTNFLGQVLFMHLPVTGRLIKELELTRMGFIMNELLEAGIPINNAVGLLHDTSQTYAYKKFFKYLKENFEQGNSFKACFSKYPGVNKLIPPPVQTVIISGAQSGHLAESFKLLGETYEEKAETLLKNLPVLLEPIFLVIVWAVVLCIALAIILPIYNLIGGLNRI